MTNGLVERRARFIYESARLAAEAAHADIVPPKWEDREQEFREQFLGVVAKQCGPDRMTSPEELHQSWMKSYLDMGWTWGATYDRDKKKHPDLVPYQSLSVVERDKDAVFIALCDIARQWIR